mmetsp:Transcript_14466/g.20397  ORF Transcript_14466/g.20397 Transcript_14466/m.20397 type:complete len:420 (-) Transcript_14466:73-1332(-)
MSTMRRVALIFSVVLSLAVVGVSWIIQPQHSPCSVSNSHGNALSTKFKARACTRSVMTPLKMTSNEDSNKENPLVTRSTSIRRLSVSGVSVSKDGFWVFFKAPSPVVSSESSPTTENGDDEENEKSNSDAVSKILPLQVTSDPQDAAAATSAESLTLLQLISGVDMAGPILPPEVLARMALLYCEDFERVLEVDVDPEEAARRNKVLEWIQKTIEQSLPEGSSRPQAYSECNVWQRSKIKLPKVSLDQVCLQQQSSASSSNNNGEVVHQWVLQCSIPEIGKVTVCPTPNIVEEASFEFDNTTSTNFLCLALALRYRAPIVLETLDDEGVEGSPFLNSPEELSEKFPMFKTVESLQDQSNRVHENIERGFEIQKLTGALRIAMEKGDEAAAKMIQEKLDKFDSLDDLPTIPDDFGIDEMQ